MPGLAPVGLLLARTDETAVAVGNVLGYPNGFEFTVNARLRHEQFVWGKSPLDPLADPRTGQDLNWPSGWASCTLTAAGPEPAATARYLSMKLTARTCSCVKSAPAGPTASGTVASRFTRCHQTARSPSSCPGCCTRWPRLRAELDSSVIHKAAERAVILWPDEPS